jgi:hypothetical protein
MYIEHIFFLKYWDDDILDNIVNEKKKQFKNNKNLNVEC